MRLFLDTNIIVDVLSKREGYVDSLTVLKSCEAGIVEGWVSAAAITADMDARPGSLITVLFFSCSAVNLSIVSVASFADS